MRIHTCAKHLTFLELELNSAAMKLIFILFAQLPIDDFDERTEIYAESASKNGYKKLKNHDKWKKYFSSCSHEPNFGATYLLTSIPTAWQITIENLLNETSIISLFFCNIRSTGPLEKAFPDFSILQLLSIYIFFFHVLLWNFVNFPYLSRFLC